LVFGVLGGLLALNSPGSNHGVTSNSSIETEERPVLGVTEEAHKNFHRITMKSQNTNNSLSMSCDTCCICLEAYQKGDDVTVLPCTHSYHEVCVRPWFVRSHRCPLCQKDLNNISPKAAPTPAPSGDYPASLRQSRSARVAPVDDSLLAQTRRLTRVRFNTDNTRRSHAASFAEQAIAEAPTQEEKQEDEIRHRL